MFKQVTPNLLVAGQITPEAVAEAAARGVTTIINNRPDDESEGQPAGEAIAAAAREAGIAYHAIPVTHAGFSLNQVNAMAEALAGADGPVLAFCRSGTRSTLLWALARAKAGERPDALAEQAAAAGYDLSPIRHSLDALAAGR